MAFLSDRFAITQQTYNIIATDSQGLVWDAETPRLESHSLQLYESQAANETPQAFIWNKVPHGWQICSPSICPSDAGREVATSSDAAVWGRGDHSAVQGFRPSRYIQEPFTPLDGYSLSIGYTPFTWPAPIAESGSSEHRTSIMPLGDSITEGYATFSTFAQGGYRCPLYTSLTESGVRLSFVGYSASLEPGLVTSCPDVNWEGHAGYNIASIQRFEGADGSVESEKPDIILLLAGTNDVAQGNISKISTHISSLLDNLFAQDPEAWIIVSTIPPMYPHASRAPLDVASRAHLVPQANEQIRLAVARYPRTTLVDFYLAAVEGIDSNIGPDGIHPTVSGYRLLASLWQRAITAYLDHY